MFGELRVKAPQFGYTRATTVEEALALLAKYGDDARILAGGQSLGPLLNLRAASPQVVIDINRVAALSGIAFDARTIRIGALTRHAAIERSPEIENLLPLLTKAIVHVGHPAIRTRGTFGGSCALADPSAELPACSLALDATFVAASGGSERRIKAGDFFRGTYTTSLRPDELITAIEIPVPSPGYRSAFKELARRHGDFAMAGVAVHARVDGNTTTDLRVVAFGVHDRPTRMPQIEKALDRKVLTTATIKQWISALDADLDPIGDIHASAAAKAHYVRVLTARALAELVAEPAPSFAPALEKSA
jgi:aerobic carbon-monoxide dehydrogenase medium subunit